MAEIRMSRKIKDLLIEYIHKYAERINESIDPVQTVNDFDIHRASEAVTKAMLKNDDLSQKDKERIQTEEMQKRILEFFEEKLIINYFMYAKKINYYEARALLNDKGVKKFKETEGIQTNLYQGKYPKDYQATIKQIEYLTSFQVPIKHLDELTAREASNVIKCLKTPTRTRPYYYSYYVNQ